MKRAPVGSLLVLVLFGLSGLSRPALGATLREVNALIGKANSGLKERGSDRAAKLQSAIETGLEALEMLEKVPGLSEEARDKKATEIMSVIYWCRKMKPLDLSGRQLASKSGAQGQGSSAAGAGGAGGNEPPAREQTEFDRLTFERVQKYAKRHGEDLEGILLRYEGVAASYPKTKWGKKAAGEADTVRKKLGAARKAVLAARQEQIDRLELKEALAALDADIRREKSPSRKAQLHKLRKDVTALDALWQRVIRVLEGLQMSMQHPLEEIGVDRKGWVLRGGPDGVRVAMDSKSAAPTLMAWAELGAAPMVRLGTKLLNMKDPEALEGLAVGATVAGDFMLAHAMFEQLLPLAPERLVAVAGYFERAQGGYRSSAEGSAKIRFDEAKKLVRQRKYAETMAALNDLRTDLAKNSSLQDYLREVNDFRRKTMRRKKIDDEGKPITAFEKRVRAMFGGDVKLDQQTGRIEVVYDFEDTGQLRDWLVARQFNQPEKKGGWTIMKGQARCMGQNSAMLVWKFPVSNFDIQADVTYESKRKRVAVCAGMSMRNPFGVWAYCRGGLARLNTGRLYMYGWWSTARFIWRPSEVATLRFTESSGFYRYRLTVNGQHGISGNETGVEPGPVAFGFDGGRGTVDNVVIRGELDMKWFLQNSMKRR